MKLFNDATSPFGRKVLVAALERDIPLEEVIVDLKAPGQLAAVNPLHQIPALLTETGLALYDSDTILDFLDAQHKGPPLIPAEGRWEVLTQVALANGMMEATLLRVMELRRPEGEKSPGFIKKLEERIGRALGHLEGLAEGLAARMKKKEAPQAQEIVIGCALEYLDFRYRESWRADQPKLAAWLAVFSQRQSMRSTPPTRNLG